MKNKILKFLLIILLIALVITLYGVYLEPKTFKTNEIKIISNIPDNYDGFKIVHISDIHYGRTVSKEMLEDIVTEINLNKPDIVVLTGDLFNKNVTYNEENISDITNALKRIETKLGKYIIKGDNDTSDKWDEVVTNSDFINLNDTYNLIFDNNSTPILISGISSNSKYGEINEKLAKINEETMNINSCYKILIMHEPDYVDNIDVNGFNLILAGHSLGGIYIPIKGLINLPNGATKYTNGHYKINETDLYVSNGLGTDNIKFRIMNRPSINFYRITK